MKAYNMRSSIKFFFTLSVFSISLMAHAYESPNFETMTNVQIQQYCDAGHGGTMEFDYCANREFQKADHLLNATYNTVVTQLKKYHATNPSIQSALPELIKAQRIWVTFRDAECGAHYTYYIDGTIRGLMFISCKTQLTEQREKDLRSFYLSTN
jgi:uncharacterized protein YecT (DUF1311 family)